MHLEEVSRGALEQQRLRARALEQVLDQRVLPRHDRDVQAVLAGVLGAQVLAVHISLRE